jgi:hypothetical protein
VRTSTSLLPVPLLPEPAELPPFEAPSSPPANAGYAEESDWDGIHSNSDDEVYATDEDEAIPNPPSTLRGSTIEELQTAISN